MKELDAAAAFARIGPVAAEVDRALAALDARVDWLTRLTPVNLDEVRSGFRASGFKRLPPLAYDDGLPDLDSARDELLALPLRRVEDGLIETLLMEKQREIDRQLELVRLRGKPGFLMAAVDLFGRVDGRLLDAAERVLVAVPDAPEPPGDLVRSAAFRRMAEAELAAYREADPGLRSRVVEDPVKGTHIHVSLGDLHVACDFRVPRSQCLPLLHHEIGTHVLTRHNGRQQPLRCLAAGLADYDDLQEGLAVLAEHLCGHLPASRLRLLAARVVAAEMAVREEPAAEVYAAMRDRCGLAEEPAFSTTVRALRGGGMTKDALYLGGLRALLDHLKHGGGFEVLFLGKFALKHLHVLEKLLERGTLVGPALLPRYLQDPAARRRLEEARSLGLTDLWQKAPAP